MSLHFHLWSTTVFLMQKGKWGSVGICSKDNGQGKQTVDKASFVSCKEKEIKEDKMPSTCLVSTDNIYVARTDRDNALKGRRETIKWALVYLFLL